MIPYKRQQTILDLLSQEEVVRFSDIQELLPEVSESTLRRDVRELEADGRLQRLSGGAVKAAGDPRETPISVKAAIHVGEKRAIAAAAAALVEDGETVYVDSGSTCSALLALLMARPVTVVTTNADAFSLAGADPCATLVMLGGILSPDLSSVYGPMTEENVGRFVFDRAFLGANGVDVRFGVTTPSMQESNKKQVVAEHAKETYVLADSSKFGEVLNVRVLPLDRVTVVSDRSDPAVAAETRVITA